MLGLFVVFVLFWERCCVGVVCWWVGKVIVVRFVGWVVGCFLVLGR